MNVPTLLRDFRERHGLSQTQLSLATGLPQPVLSMYENGHRSPGIETLERILSAGAETLLVSPRQARQDDRSVANTIEIHRIVLEKLLADPETVLNLGRRRLQFQIEEWGDHASVYTKAWQQVLDGPRASLARLLISESEDDVELLKMSPFTTILDDNERAEVARRSKSRRSQAA
jgi:transcriptional regulator with XRE-family HTH domain